MKEDLHVWENGSVPRKKKRERERLIFMLCIPTTELSIKDFTAGRSQLILLSVTNIIMKLLSLVHSPHNSPPSSYAKISTYKSKIAADTTFYLQKGTWDVLTTGW